MVQRYVYGVYENYLAAEQQADQLIAQGIPASAVSLVSNKRTAENSGSDYHQVHHETLEDDRNWFEKLFGLDNNDAGDINFDEYSTSLNADKVLLVLDRDYEGQVSAFGATGREDYVAGEEVTPFDHAEGNHYVDETRRDVDVDRTTDVDDENIRLHEERLNVDKDREQVGEVEISKEVVEETQTIDVPVEREEIHIKHRKPADGVVENGEAFQDEDIVIPISEERVNVEKDTVVTDEVEIEKTTHTDTETVQETTRREELRVDDEGDVIREDR
ncbi:YsnF/AvaK domain-containing protein [Aerococcaceae bacterium DSM 111020]|nr:YsnF/AvaK domain-containing protein [Aerococcaceae bacterium DSM 111020]